MKYILLFIYRLLNIIVSIIGVIIIALMFATFPVWLLFGYLFKGTDFFDKDGEEYSEAVWCAIHYPLDIFYDFIDDMDDNEFKDDTKFNFNNFWNNNFLNNKFWK